MGNLLLSPMRMFGRDHPDARSAVGLAGRRREERFEEARERFQGQPEEEREAILLLSLTQLINALQQEQFSASAVLFAYAWKALQVQAEFNCVCEFLLDSFAEAAALDEQWRGNPNKPPLFGVPFSVKENNYLAGLHCTGGIPRHLMGPPCTRTSSLVTQLRSLGAVPFVSCNVPQALLSFCCSNPIYGTTLHPQDPDRTPGGSSGGDACLLAARGAPFSTGNDVGGSLRIPAAFCGLVTMKPTSHRYVVTHVRGSTPGRGRVAASSGVFTRTVREQCLLLGHLLRSPDQYRRLVPKCALVPFREDLARSGLDRPLRIGYFVSNGFIPGVPATERAVRQTMTQLEAHSRHELIPFDVPRPAEAAAILYKCILCDGGAYLRKMYDSNPLDPHIAEFARLQKIPAWVGRLLARLYYRSRSPQLATMLSCSISTAAEIRLAQEQLDNYVQEFTDKWLSLELDVLLCPAFPVPAVPHSGPSKIPMCAFATAFFNMLDFPAGVVPAGRVSEEDEQQLREDWPTGKNPLLQNMKSAALGTVGLPLAVQVVALPFEEELCLYAMAEVERVRQIGGE